MELHVKRVPRRCVYIYAGPGEIRKMHVLRGNARKISRTAKSCLTDAFAAIQSVSLVAGADGTPVNFVASVLAGCLGA